MEPSGNCSSFLRLHSQCFFSRLQVSCSKTLRNLNRVDPGFDPNNVLLFWVYPGNAGFRGPATTPLYSDYLRQLQDLPGGESLLREKAELLRQIDELRANPASDGSKDGLPQE